jgi:hypothetical protein
MLVAQVSGKAQKEFALTKSQYERIQDLTIQRLLGNYQKEYDTFVEELREIKADR